jgi:hypothetical protein
MKIKELKELLCVYDKNSPYYVGFGKTGDDCYCDNCFYGRDKLAREILRLKRKYE